MVPKMILANVFFYSVLFFILGIIFYFYGGLNFLLLLTIYLILFFIFKRPFFSLVLILLFICGYFYVLYFHIVSSNQAFLILDREISPTSYKRFLSYYKGEPYIVYLPYHLKVNPKDKIYGDFEIFENKIFFKSIKKIEKSPFTPIFNLKDKINEIIYKNYSLSTAEIISGILYGEEIRDNEIRNLLKETGLSHITAMSGFNLTILSLFSCHLFKFIFPSIFLINFFSIIFILFFVVFAGFQSSVIRAGIMSIFLILAKTIGRVPLKRNLIILPVFFIGIFNPMSLVSDFAFHLSFLGVLGILYLEESLRNFLKLKIFSEIISAQIMVLPLIWYKFGEMNLSSIFTNLIFVPFIPFLMLLGFLGIFLILFSPLHNILNFPFQLFLALLKPFSYFPKIYTYFPLEALIFIYLILFLWIYKLNKNEIDFNFKLG